jgi:hypothetical protein
MELQGIIRTDKQAGAAQDLVGKFRMEPSSDHLGSLVDYPAIA